MTSHQCPKCKSSLATEESIVTNLGPAVKLSFDCGSKWYFKYKDSRKQTARKELIVNCKG